MMQELQGDDPWQDVQGQTAPVDSVPARLRIQTIDNVAPLDAQIGVFPKKAVPDALREALFGQPELTEAEIKAAGGDPAAVPPMRTYAILDAAKVTNLVELLEDSKLEHRCLFKGAAYDDLKNVAPWIVRLEVGNAFTRNLFTRGDAYWHLWDSEVGIYVRSRATLDGMWRHFRKFTKVQDEAGKWLYFRFWDSEVIRAIVDEAFLDIHGRLFATVDGQPVLWLAMDQSLGMAVTIPAERESSECNIKLNADLLACLESHTARQKKTEEIAEAYGRIYKNAIGNPIDKRTLMEVWTVLDEVGFNTPELRIRALELYIRLALKSCGDLARGHLMEKEAGPGIRIWRLEQALMSLE